MKAQLTAFLTAGIDILYPTSCQICERERSNVAEGFVCHACWSDGVRFIKPPFCERCGLPYPGEITTAFECSNCKEVDLHFRSARSAVTATRLLLDVIHRYKYNHQLWFESFLADLLIRQAAPVLRQDRWDFIVPVPLHPVKKREREFNQAERIGAHLSRATGIPMNKDLLRRVERTRTQTLLTRQERAANVRGAFAMNSKTRLQGQRIVLIDDVFTTGATTNACAKVLCHAGSGDVCVWTVARGV